MLSQPVQSNFCNFPKLVGLGYVWSVSVWIRGDCELLEEGTCLFSFNLERAKLGLNALQDNEQSEVEIQDEKAQALPDKMV